jgi:hypothetical protein
MIDITIYQGTVLCQAFEFSTSRSKRKPEVIYKYLPGNNSQLGFFYSLARGKEYWSDTYVTDVCLSADASSINCYVISSG